MKPLVSFFSLILSSPFRTYQEGRDYIDLTLDHMAQGEKPTPLAVEEPSSKPSSLAISASDRWFTNNKNAGIQTMQW